MHSFDMKRGIEVLERTPVVIETLLHGLSTGWIFCNEGPDTWCPFDIVGHLLHGEKTDWIPRLNIILEQGENKTFTPFDRFAQLTENKGKDISVLLDEFKRARLENLQILRSKDIGTEELKLPGMHPALGEVTLRNLLATWVAHDLNHIAQISRVMARQYTKEVGPWRQYLGIMKA